MEFKYYYGTEAEQFSFIRIPKIMISDSIFSELSLSAKLLYGMLLDRMSLSMKNRWFDSENRVYIIYQIADIQDDMGVSRNKAIELLRDLEKFGLVEKKRRGLGMPSLLYVKNFLVDKDCSNIKREKDDTLRSSKTDISRSPENGTSRSLETDTSRSPQNATSRSLSNHVSTSSENVISYEREIFGNENGVDIKKYKDNRCKNSDNEINLKKNKIFRSLETETSRSPETETSRSLETETSRSPETETSRSLETETSRSPETETSRSPETETSRSPHIDTLKNNTNNNNNNNNSDTDINIISNPILSKNDLKKNTKDGIGYDDYCKYKELVKTNIEYNNLQMAHPHDTEMLQGILDLILEILVSQRQQILIASNTYPTEVVKSRFLKLDYMHINYVLNCLKSNTTKVKNIKKYLLAALFNAPATIDGYYNAEVNHDFPQLTGRWDEIYG